MYSCNTSDLLYYIMLLLFQPPELFREEMVRTAGERSNMLQDYVETVMEGLQTVSNILAVKKVI